MTWRMPYLDNIPNIIYTFITWTAYNFQVLKHLTAVLKSDTDNDCLKAGTAWTLEMIGQHGAKHSKSIFACNAVSAMIDVRTINKILQAISV